MIPATAASSPNKLTFSSHVNVSTTSPADGVATTRVSTHPKKRTANAAEMNRFVLSAPAQN